MKPTLRILLQLDRGADPVAGALVEADGTRRPFHGYMNLISALEAARAAGADGSVDTAAAAEPSEDARGA